MVRNLLTDVLSQPTQLFSFAKVKKSFHLSVMMKSED